MMDKEEWRPVVGFEELFEVSNLGRVRSLPRTITMVKRLPGKILKAEGIGYPCVHIRGTGRRISHLVADAFIGNRSGKIVDHIDRNPKNNRLDNLRICTSSQNSMNRKYKSYASGYKGVHFHKGKWRARIHHEKQEIHLGYFETAEIASKAYKEAAKLYHGEFAPL